MPGHLPEDLKWFWHGPPIHSPASSPESVGSNSVPVSRLDVLGEISLDGGLQSAIERKTPRRMRRVI
jgi:hypothetical protein